MFNDFKFVYVLNNNEGLDYIINNIEYILYI